MENLRHIYIYINIYIYILYIIYIYIYVCIYDNTLSRSTFPRPVQKFTFHVDIIILFRAKPYN